MNCGSGTDPVEGANLAISILEYIKNFNCICLVTTHYPELKKYALTTSNVLNASVEFDVNTMSPTYRLLIGIPGKSNAFEISEKLGLNESIINHAKSLVTKNDLDFETILKKVHDDKVIIENEKEQIKINSARQSQLTKDLENTKADLNEKKSQYIEKAKQEARDILLNAKEDANSIIKEMENMKDSSNLNNLRNSLNSKIKTLNTNSSSQNQEQQKSDTSKALDPTTLVIGQNVFVKTYQKEGTVCSLPSKSNTLLVMIGPMKLKVNISDLEVSHNKATKEEKVVSSFNSFSKSKTAKTEVNVIGLDSVSAIETVDKFLDDCSLSSLNFVRIVHGKGSGILRKSIHEFLRTHPTIKSYRLGMYGEGESGVTVVEFKN